MFLIGEYMMKIGSYDIIEFLNVVEQLHEKFGHIFCPELLDAFDNHLNIKYSVIVVYDKNAFINSFSHNLPKEIDDDYNNYYFRSDFLSKYIKNNWALIQKSEKPIYSTDVISPDIYDKNEYISFIYSKGGLYYTLCMPFDEYYLALHRRKEDGDFSEEQKEILTNLYKLLKKKSKFVKAYQNISYIKKFKDEVMDSLRIGFMVFDEHYRLIDYNKFAIQCINSMCGSVRMNTIFNDFYQYLELPPTATREDKNVSKNGFNIDFQHSYTADKFNIVNHYLTVVIRKQSSMKEMSKSVAVLNTLTVREIQIVDCLSRGMHYQAAADYLSISINTIRTHLKNIYKKVDVNNQRELLIHYEEYKKFNSQI